MAKPVLLFHSSCVEFKSFAISDDFLAVTEHSIRLSELEERQRFKRIQNLLAPKIYDLLPVKFPSEITTMISSHLVSESAMVTAENQSVSSQASDIIVDLSVDVYASYSVLDGVRYVKSLRNDVDETGEYHRVLNVEQQSTVSMVRICEDHLGIRLVQFLPLTSLSSKAPVVEGWWRDVSPSRLSGNAPRANFSAIRVESDVSMLPLQGLNADTASRASSSETSRTPLPVTQDTADITSAGQVPITPQTRPISFWTTTLSAVLWLSMSA